MRSPMRKIIISYHCCMCSKGDRFLSTSKIWRSLGSQPEKQRLRSPTFFMNLQITFDSKEKVGDLRIERLLSITDLTIKNLDLFSLFAAILLTSHQ